MILGHVRDGLPRIVLSLICPEEAVLVEFVVDTGFDGCLALPPSILSVVRHVFLGTRTVHLADKTPRDCAYYEVFAIWDGAERTLEATTVGGRPLIGYEAMEGTLLQIEMTDSGEVLIDAM